MPYKAKAAHQREEWMTLLEVVTHIRSADNCDENAAREQLIAALVDGALGPLRWQREHDDRPTLLGVSSITRPTDTPPLDRAWLEAEINWETGHVRDAWGEYKPGTWRVLLILRHNVLRLWRRQPDSNNHRSESENVVKLPTRDAGGRPTPRDKVYGELDKMWSEGCDMSRPQKTLAEEVAKRKNKKLGKDRNWSERTTIGHVSAWLRKNQLI
jgi:hypothetical protein